MKVKELIALLRNVDPEARVFHGYDGNIVVTEPKEVIVVKTDEDISMCWNRVKIGDVVILCEVE